jgi:hypothetical protein
MDLAETLLSRFGRNWGIDKKDLQAGIEEWAAGSVSPLA